MSFRLLGVSVDIQLGFWLTAFLLRLNLVIRNEWDLLAVWVGVVFVSVLVHEFGHALAVKRHRIEPEITLHWLGGTTTWRALMPISRPAHVFISFAGPLAGFLFAGVLYLLRLYIPGLQQLPRLAEFAFDSLLYANVVWGVFNLVPVLPFDGGHILEHTLGPRRARLTAAISFLAAGSLAMLFFAWGQIYITLLFAMSAFQSFQRFRSEPEMRPANAARRMPSQDDEPISGEALGLLRRARRAVEEERPEEALSAAGEVLSMSPPPGKRALREASELYAWAKLLSGDHRGAAESLAQARRFGSADAALIGAVHLASGELKQARKVLEDARAAGDDRKEVVGPLIRVLVEQGEVPRAAAVAFDIVDSLSEEDTRKMAEIAFENGAFDWAARLYEAVFRRNGESEDAYDAARASAKDGNLEQALELLRRAVEAGFSDRARAWSDAALESLRHGPLETVLPRP